uniref:Uncharacterized protein n=1 Tax=Chrysotila carterae TaxID=13221 RepID=A0A7S4B082_CHRCT
MAAGQSALLDVLRLAAWVVCVDFVIVGAVLATVGWWLSNNYLRVASAVDAWEDEPMRRQESVEWLYAFDVHCNAFFPLFLLLHVLQFLLLPLLLRPGLVAALASNSLYAAALSVYHYITFLGYNELPFLRSCEVFVYPIGAICAAYVCSLPFVWYAGLNCTEIVADVYFG